MPSPVGSYTDAMYPPPAAPPYPPAPPPRSGGGHKVLWIVLGSVAGVVLLGGLCCGGFVFVGFGALEDDIAAKLRDNPVLVEQIGTLESVDLNLTKSGDYSDPDTMVYDVKGSKGSGVAIVKSRTVEGGEEIEKATLKLSDGREFELVGSDQ